MYTNLQLGVSCMDLEDDNIEQQEDGSYSILECHHDQDHCCNNPLSEKIGQEKCRESFGERIKINNKTYYEIDVEAYDESSSSCDTGCYLI